MKNISNLIQLSIIIVLILIVFRAWIFGSIISAGDNWYYYPSMYSNHFLNPYSWYTQATANGLGGQGFAYINTYIVVGFLLEIAKLFHLSWDLTSKLGLYILFLIISSISSIFLIKKLFPENRVWILAPFIFIFNTYVLMTVGGGQIITALSYSLVPFSIYSVISLIDLEKRNLKLKFVFLTSILFFLQAILDLRIAFVTTIAVFVYLIISFIQNKFKLNLINSIYFVCAFLLFALMCSYWLIPILLYGINPIEQLGVDYSSATIVKFLSFAKLENSLGLMHPYWPENIFGKIGFMKAEFLFLPIAAFSSLLFLDKEKRKYILFFALIGLFGIFLGKGASEPLGGVYLFLFEHVPGFQLFRDSIKWYVLIAISFSILIPYSLDKISLLIEEKINKKNFYLLVEILFIIYICIFLRPAFMNQLSGTFKERIIPKEYISLNNFLSSQNNFYRTLWVPNTMLLGYYSNMNPQISARDYFKEYSQEKLYKVIAKNESNNSLDYASVKYVIIPKDTEKEIFLTDREFDKEKYKNAVKSLDKISWLEKVKAFGDIVVYENKNYKDHIWCDCDAKINYQFVNPTLYKISVKNYKKGDKIIFSEAYDSLWTINDGKNIKNSERFEKSLNSFILPGDGNYTIEYSAQKLVDKSLIISLIAVFLTISGLTFLVIKNKNENK